MLILLIFIKNSSLSIKEALKTYAVSGKVDQLFFFLYYKIEFWFMDFLNISDKGDPSPFETGMTNE